MGFVDRIQENAARSAAARQAGQSAARGGTGRGGSARSPRKPRRAPAPPMDARERYIGYAAALATAVAFAILWAPHIGQPHFGEVVTKAAKGVKAKTTEPVSPTAELVWGLVLAALVGWASVLKKRWLLAGVAFYVGLLGPWGNYHYVGYVLMALGAWLLFRNAKLQAEVQRTADVVTAKATRSKSSRPGPARTTGSARPARTTGSARKATAAPGDSTSRPLPAPSKRYTPPQAPSKDDRRERRERRESVRAGVKAGPKAGAKASEANRSASPKV